jgi:hypothetical protein
MSAASGGSGSPPTRLQWINACAGLRLFEDADMEKIQLKRLRVKELLAGRTHLEFRVVKEKVELKRRL